MRLSNPIVVDIEETLGELKFSAIRRERFVLGEDEKPTEEVKERTYDLRSKEQGMMIQVSLPGSVSAKKIPFKTEVELVNPVFDTVSNANFMGADAEWYIKADDIVPRNKQANTGNSKPNNQANNQQGQQPQDKK